MDSSIVSQSPQQHKFENVADLITALQHHHGQTFNVFYQHFGGHSSTLIAQSTDHTEMIIARNGRGWFLGRWGKHFGHVDIERTVLLYEDDSKANTMTEHHTRLMDEVGLSDAAAATATRRRYPSPQYEEML